MNKKFIISGLCVFLVLFAAANAVAQPKTKLIAIRVEANAGNARVFVNDKFSGNAPTVLQLPRGKYTIKVTAEGYRDFVQVIVVESNTVLNAQLIKIERPPQEGEFRPAPKDEAKFERSFNLNIQADVRGAKVYIDDQFAGNAPARTRLPEGDHFVKITAPGYEDYTETINLNRDMRISANLHRARRLYTLSITANTDDAKVFINNREQEGSAPMDLKLDEGRYAIKVQKRGYKSFETSVDLRRDMRIEAHLGAPKSRIMIIPPQGRRLRIDVTLDGRRQNGYEFEVERGRHVIRVETGGLSAEREVDCREGRVYRFMLDLDLQAPNEEDQ